MHITAERIREATEALASTELETFMYQEPTARRGRSTRRSTRRTTRRSTRRSSRRRCRCGSPCCSYPWFNKSFGCCFKGHGCGR
ncbi:CotG/ExsB N-terminal domain-containing protein [Priestia aryabhattai]|uniref:CotG/ExsB N-terminal domain-containing protein n=1 Tax=Priestia aryabhattai TaxID=412384 RepID=UPI003D28179C